MLYYLTYDEAIESHNKIVVHTGGLVSKSNLHYILDAVRDLDYADEKQAIVSKSAYLLYKLIILHPFMDGNKRTAFVLTKAFLNINGWRYESVGEAELVKVTLDIASGTMSQKQVENWLQRILIKEGANT